MDLTRTIWLLPPAFSVHVLEESAGFTAWVQRHGRRDYTRADFVRINASGLAVTLLSTAAVTRWPGRRRFAAYYALIATQQALFNPVFHVGSGAASGEWSPGTVTAVVLFLPLWWRVTRAARRDGILSRRAMAAGIAVGGAVHAAAVANQVFGVGSVTALAKSTEKARHHTTTVA
jgi:hypothetical protein